MQGALCQLRQLRSLYIGIDHNNSTHPSTSQLMVEIAAALPDLATLQWQESGSCTGVSDWAAAFSDDFVTAVAGESNCLSQAKGLRLLQTNNSVFRDLQSLLLPSLQYLALSNDPLHGDLLLLLQQQCSTLSELYLVKCYVDNMCSSSCLLSIGRACPRLRVLVLHTLEDNFFLHEVGVGMPFPLAPYNSNEYIRQGQSQIL